jgi:hypothetical protein
MIAVQVEHIFHAIQDVTSNVSGSIPSNSDAISSNGHVSSNNSCSDFYFGNGSKEGVPQSLDYLYPLPSQMLFIWRTYVENVDPFIKVIDVAAVEEIMTNLRGRFDSLEPRLQALLFAVSLAAITSLDEEETVNCFDMSRNQLLDQFRLGTERALANAGLLVTKELETIQAFVIYLSLLPHIGGQELLSPLLGLLLRIATSSQLHRDAENFTMPAMTPAEIETRRRLWWHIIFIDSTSRTPHAAGLSASDTIFDTKTPSHIFDNGKRNSTLPFDAQNESVICIMRCEIWRLCRFLHAHQGKSLEQKLETLNHTRSMLEDLHIANLYSNHDLASLIKTMTSLAFSKVEHTIYMQHFRNLKDRSQSPSQEMTQQHLESSINILKDAHRLRTEPSWKRWRWQLQGDFPWASMSAVFIQLCRSPWSSISERGWALTRQILEEVPDRVKASAYWDILSKLIAATEAHRGRNPRELTVQTCPDNETNACSFINTKAGANEASNLSHTQSANSHIPIGNLDFSRMLTSSIIDESNELESIVTFNPMEWQAWDEALIADDQSWALDY